MTTDNVSLENPDNVKLRRSPDGNSREFGLRRLRRDRPDLHALVMEKRKSVHAAMVEAGFRPLTMSIPVDPERAAKTIKKHFSVEQIQALVALVQPHESARRMPKPMLWYDAVANAGVEEFSDFMCMVRGNEDFLRRLKLWLDGDPRQLPTGLTKTDGPDNGKTLMQPDLFDVEPWETSP